MARARMAPARGLENAFRWQLRLRLERQYAYLRAVAVLAGVSLPLLGPHTPGTATDLKWAVAVVALVWAGMASGLLFRWPETARRVWPGYAIADFVLILAAIAVTGPRGSNLLPLLFIAALGVPQRLPLGGGIAAGAVAAAAWAVLAPAAQRWDSGLIALIAGVQVLGTFLVRDDAMQVARDPLTGCFGRGQIMAEIRRLVDQRAYPFSLILADLDGFKAVNDLFGHLAGDHMLQAAARHMASSIRGTDLLARYGGDEFLVVLADTDGATAQIVADRLRDALANGRLELGTGAGLCLTLSAGVIQAQEGQSVAALMEAVDRHLYAGKRSQAPATAS